MLVPSADMAARRMPTTARRGPRRPTVPSLRYERACWEAGDGVVVGIDEVGRGAWAGPVSVGAVVVPSDRRLYKLRDSKMLTRDQREQLFPRIVEWVVAAGVGHASAEECDRLGMTEALRVAAERALEHVVALTGEPDRILLDGSFDYLRRPGCVRTIVRGDACSLAIAAASIVAKVTRDRMMAVEAEHYPAYEFDSNRGYPAPRHQYALQAYGPTAIHRRSWIFMDSLAWYRTGSFDEVVQPMLFADDPTVLDEDAADEAAVIG